MFERFTENARKAVFFARYEASQTGSQEIDTEHLLLGIMRADGPGSALFPPATTLESVRSRIHKDRPTGPHTSTSADLPVSASCKRVLSYAAEEATRLGDREINTKHLLAGLLRLDTSLAAAILREHGITAERLQQIAAPVEPDSPGKEIPGCRDLTELAARGGLGPLVGRARELERIAVILSRRKRNNVALIGESGIGKTAIVEGFAQHMGFQRPMLEVDASSLVEPEQFNDIRRANTALLCIDRLFDFPAAAAIVEPFIARGEIQCIATGARALWLARWFEIVEVLPPNEDEAIAILSALKPRYEKFHHVEFGPGTIEAAVYASSRFLAHRHLPDRALDLLDEAGSRNNLKKSSVVVPEDIAQVIAGRTGLPLTAVNAILAQRSNGHLDRMLRELSARVPFDGNEWIPFLAGYLARCSKDEAGKLIDAIGAANAIAFDEE